MGQVCHYIHLNPVRAGICEIKDEQSLKASLSTGVNQAREMRESAWALRLERCLEVSEKNQAEIEQDNKSADRKVALTREYKP